MMKLFSSAVVTTSSPSAMGNQRVEKPSQTLVAFVVSLNA